MIGQPKVLDAEVRYWRLPAVLAYTQRSRSAIYADPTFPRPIRLGPNTAAWKRDAVIAWCAERESAQQVAA